MKFDVAWVKEKFDKGETLKYIFFWGHTGKGDVGKFVFSQWYPALFSVDGVDYKTSEHWMMGQKALLFGDHEMFNKIIAANKPGEVKDLGRQIRDFDAEKWDGCKYEIVKEGNLHKFQQNSALKEFLLGTGDRIIVEASPVDPVWGIGLAHDAKCVENPHEWKGLNLLGFVLMEVRDALAGESIS